MERSDTTMKLDKAAVQKICGIASIVVAGVTAVFGAISEQKKEAELEELKRKVSELSSKE